MNPLQPQSGDRFAGHFRVDVVIPTLNAGPEIVEMVRLLQQQTLAPSRILVIDSQSSDGTREWLMDLGLEVTTIDRSDFDHGGTRNQAALLSDAEILVFMTQDAMPADDFLLERLTEDLRLGRAVAAFARQVAKHDAGFVEAATRAFNYPPLSNLKSKRDVEHLGVKAFFFSNVCSAIRRDVFWQVGGFPQQTIMNEDMVLAARLLNADQRIAYCADARVFHSHNYSLQQQFKRNFDIGAFFSISSALFVDDCGVPFTGGVSGEGLKLVRFQLGQAMAARNPGAVVRIFLEATVKFLGFQVGLRQVGLPIWLKRRIGLHAYHWRTNDFE